MAALNQMPRTLSAPMSRDFAKLRCSAHAKRTTGWGLGGGRHFDVQEKLNNFLAERTLPSSACPPSAPLTPSISSASRCLDVYFITDNRVTDPDTIATNLLLLFRSSLTLSLSLTLFPSYLPQPLSTPSHSLSLAAPLSRVNTRARVDGFEYPLSHLTFPSSIPRFFSLLSAVTKLASHLAQLNYRGPRRAPEDERTGVDECESRVYKRVYSTLAGWCKCAQVGCSSLQSNKEFARARA
jgi:hypothetical protein